MIVFVALGSALGGAARYLAGILFERAGAFPIGTLLVNVVGSFLLGLILRSVGAPSASTAGFRAFATIGFCGGFTTFSTFSFEVARFLEQGQYGRAAGYAGLSAGLSVAAIFAGYGAAALAGSSRSAG